MPHASTVVVSGPSVAMANFVANGDFHRIIDFCVGQSVDKAGTAVER
jgi:hypothetical protein